jgi:predicted nucleic acid-binding protein
VAKIFFDTNILLYAAMARPADADKKAIAVDLIERFDFSISAQVLAEFYSNATNGKKFTTPLTPDEAAQWVALLSEGNVGALTSDVILGGIKHAREYQISYWDGAIIAAAEALGMDIIYSEDLNHTQSYGTIKVINPFLE